LGAKPPAAGGKQGFGGGASDAEEILTVFSQKFPFLSILWSKFLLKTRFEMIAKNVLMRPRARAPTCPPLCYATGEGGNQKKKTLATPTPLMMTVPYSNSRFS